jgi:glycosyltransferase involved in cell wall biosynthesis
MRDLMRALVVLAQPPVLEGNAPGRCAAALLEGLSAHGVDVKAVAARQFFALDGRVPGDLDVEIVDVSAAGRSVRRLHRPRSSLLGPFSERVRELSRECDVVHLEETETAWCNLGLERPSSLHMHFRVLRDRRVAAPWRNEFRFVAEFAAAEVVAARRYRYLVANSAPIAESLRRLNRKAEVVVAPLALDPRPYSPAPLDGQPLVGLIGSGDWPPTANAIHRLLERVWPEVERRDPDARLRIAGRRTAGLAPQPGGSAERVEFVGEVESAAGFFADLSVLLYPVERGSGMKVKVLEALASGVPVVTTREGAEGIAENDGVLVRESDDDLARATLELLGDPAARRQRGLAARETFLARYAPEPATAPLADLLRRMADSG